MGEQIELDYDFLMQKALRYLMRDVLSLVADVGDAPGDHHFYIEFLTQAPGVSIPDHLVEDYPERMTIVLQHQFDSLSVGEDHFDVTLWFKRKEARLHIPFDAVTSFADPSVQFGLRFDAAADKDAPPDTVDEEKPAAAKAKAEDKSDEAAGKEKSESGADIVSLDAFRKK